MRLLHYSKQPLLSVRSESQTGGRAALSCDKPNGLWVSVEGEDDWPSWCRSEDWGLDRLATETEIVLDDSARILVIDSPAALALFHCTYRTVPKIYETMPSHLRSYGIDWAAVAREHQGIIIAPYQWSLRHDREASWYYGWDCASGVIWDASAVAELRPMAVAEAA